MTKKVEIDRKHLKFFHDELVDFNQDAHFDYKYDSSCEYVYKFTDALLAARKALGITVLSDWEKKHRETCNENV